MKKVLLFNVCLFALCSVKGQTEDRKWNVGAHTGYTQYSGDLGQGFYAFDQAAYGFGGVSVSRYLTKRLDASLLMTVGQAGYLAPRDYSMEQTVPYNFNIMLSTANLFLKYNLRSRESYFLPYIFLGGGVINQSQLSGWMRKKAEFGAPSAGAGINFQLNEITTIQLQEMFMYTSADDIDYRVKDFNDMYLFHSIGLTFNIGKWQPRPEGSRAGSRIARCYEMGTGYTKKMEEPKKIKTKAKLKKPKKLKRYS
jgi:OmpA-OmpF porin, OOP family